MLVSAVFAIGLVATISFSYIVASLDAAERWRRFDDLLEYHATAMRTEISRIAGIENVTRSFFAASQEVEAHEFSLFASALLAQFKDLNSVVWVPRIQPEQRDEHWRQAQARELTGYSITGADGAPVTRAGDLYPTWYVAQQGDASLVPLGFEWGTVPPVHDAMNEARDAGKIVASGSLNEWLQPEGRTLSLRVAPVYTSGLPTGTVEERRAATEGFIVVVVWPDALLQQVAALHSKQPDGIALHLLDVTDADAPYPLAEYPELEDGGDDTQANVQTLMALSRKKPQHLAELAMTGRVWLLVGLPTEASSVWSASVIGTTVGGLLLAFLLAALVWLVISHIGKGELARLQAISSSASDGIITSDEAGIITSFNAAAEVMFGKSAEQLQGKPLTGSCPSDSAPTTSAALLTT